MARLHFLLILRSLRQLLPIDERWRILEAGTKQGFLSFWLARSTSHQIVGLDLDQTIVSANQQLAEKLNLPNLTFTQADLTQSLDPVGTFDLVVCVHVLEHIKEDQTALKNLAKIINPGGYLLILVPGGIDTVPEFTQHELDILDHVRPGYSLADLTQKVETAGFRVISGSPGFGLWGSWACSINFNWCLQSRSLILNGLGSLLATGFTFAEYWLPIGAKWDVLLVAQKDG